MLLREHVRDDGTRSHATYSDCGLYRYRLTRSWGSGPLLGVVMLNPSTATEARNDPTIARVEARARAQGFGSVCIGNLFAFRAVSPEDLFRAPDPEGPHNDAALLTIATDADVVLCAWGADTRAAHRARAVRTVLARSGRPLWVLALSKGGAPRHPLYLPSSAQLMPWRPENADNLN